MRAGHAMQPAHATNCCGRARASSRSRRSRGRERATAALAEIETVASRYTVTAPRAGIVEALPYKLGERPAAGKPVAILLADGVPYARVYVPEPLRTAFVAGHTGRGSRGWPARSACKGTVRYISAEAAFTPYYALTQKDRSRLAYLAEVTLDERRPRHCLPACRSRCSCRPHEP